MKRRVLIVQTALRGNTGIVMSTDEKDPHLHQVRLTDGRNYWFAEADMETIR